MLYVLRYYDAYIIMQFTYSFVYNLPQKMKWKIHVETYVYNNPW